MNWAMVLLFVFIVYSIYAAAEWARSRGGKRDGIGYWCFWFWSLGWLALLLDKKEDK